MKLSEAIKIIKYLFMNDMQILFLKSKHRFKMWQGGRGSGKTAVTAPQINDVMACMPGSKMFMYGSDLTQMKTKELVEVLEGWQRMGITEYSESNPMGDYITFKQPPKGWTITNKYKMWSNVISFPDGCTIELISQQMRSNRGGSYDYGIVIEASLLSANKFFKDMFPMVRGRVGKYKSNYYLGWLIMGNMPWIQEDYILEKFEQLAVESPKEYYLQYSTIWDNVKVLGKDYIEKVLKEAPEMVKRIEYLNEKIKVGAGHFYRYFSNKRHIYRNQNYVDPFYKANAPLYLSLDFNKNLNSLIVLQPNERTKVISIQKEFYTDASEDYTKLANDVDDYYKKYHLDLNIRIRGDVNGHHKLDQNGKSFYDNLAAILRAKGWRVEIEIKSSMQNPEHLVKHWQINEVLQEKDVQGYRIRINADECPFTIVSIIGAKVDKDRKKDKSSESKLKGDDRKKATDLSDCLDYGVWPTISKQFKANATYSVEVHSLN